MDSYLQGNNRQPDLSPWDPNIQQKQLYSKIISYNIKNGSQHRNLNKLNLRKLESNFSQLSKKATSDFRRESNSFEDLIALSRMDQNQPTFAHSKNLHYYAKNRTEPVEQIRQAKKQIVQPDNKNVFGIDSFRRYKDLKENIKLSKVQQQQISNFQIMIKKRKSQSICNSLKKNDTHAFLKKNLISRQCQKTKLPRIGNLVLPKIQICNMTNRLL